MISIKAFNKFAFLICLLGYMSCYLRFEGQIFLLVVQFISAVRITPYIFKSNDNYLINCLVSYWVITTINFVVLYAFFQFIMWNDFLQIPIVSIIPNLTAIYFYKLLTKTIDHENARKPNIAL